MPSSLIDVLQRQPRGRRPAPLHLPAEPSELTAPVRGVGPAPDPRRVRGRRYRLGFLIAVLRGTTTPAGIARCAVDAAPEVRERIGLHRPPRATTLGCLLARLNGDALDDVVGARLARHASDPAVEGAVELVGVAVGVEAVRGSRTGKRTAIIPAGRPSRWGRGGWSGAGRWPCSVPDGRRTPWGSGRRAGEGAERCAPTGRSWRRSSTATTAEHATGSTLTNGCGLPYRCRGAAGVSSRAAGVGDRRAM